MKNSEHHDAPRKNPLFESDGEAFRRFVRGSWYWALAVYAAVVAIRLLSEETGLWLGIWHDLYEITMFVGGFYAFYLYVRMKLEGRLPRGISDQLG